MTTTCRLRDEPRRGTRNPRYFCAKRVRARNFAWSRFPCHQRVCSYLVRSYPTARTPTADSRRRASVGSWGTSCAELQLGVRRWRNGKPIALIKQRDLGALAVPG